MAAPDTEPGTGFAIEAAQSLAFARLSGDFNPLHVDPVAARRLQFGGTVCHGVHLVLKSLDLAVAAGHIEPTRLQGVQVVFQSPALTGQRVDLAFTDQGARWRIQGSREGRVLFSVMLPLGDPIPLQRAPDAPAFEPGAAAVDRPFDVALAGPGPALAGTLPTGMDPALFASLFPALAAAGPAPLMAAELLASTRLVGMECPGLHSVYCELKLVRAEPGSEGAGLRWSVNKADARFKKVRIGVQGQVWAGTLDAIFRDAPVLQASLADLAKQVDAQRFAGQRALVVGGSRGLCEVVAKLLLAGGAEVTLTYASGQAEAAAIQAQAHAAGGACHTLQLDVTRLPDSAGSAALAAGRFTHLYYFATPAIAKGQPLQWSEALFDRFQQFYVRGFMQLGLGLVAAQAAGAGPLRVLVPSSVFIDQPVRGFAEYGAAKAAGEAAAAHLALTGKARVLMPRLPRLRTDQNSDPADPEVQDPVPVMLKVLHDLDALEAAA
jgi:NADP-dependent 3-hydroxy acid dehydrogenase YdfG